MEARVTMFCPFCNAEGSRQPILSPMVCAYVLDGAAQGTAQHPIDGLTGPHYEYRCERCGYTEIHERRLGEAA